MTHAAEQAAGLERLTTGVPGLDIVLKGGLFRAGVYILRGAPGSGKTILANQICFHRASAGEKVVYVSLLAESHARMLQHIGTLGYFDRSAIPENIYYVSAFRTLEDEGLRGLMDLLRREVQGHGATLLVLDGLLAVEESSLSDREFRKFVHELQAHMSLQSCTALMLTNGGRSDLHPEHTMVDGVLCLEDVAVGGRRQREIEVLKFRGSGQLRGRHQFRIDDAGIHIFPRIESLYARPSAEWRTNAERRVTTGLPDLDEMMQGGIPSGSTTMALGPSGAGKTVTALHFAAAASAEEPTLFYGFYETPPELVAQAGRLGLDLERPLRDGHLEILWQPPTEQLLDDLGGRLLEAVQRRGVRRLVIEGLGGFIDAADKKERLSHFFSALSHQCRGHGVTTLYTAETPTLIGPEIQVPVSGLSAIVENMLMLRYSEVRGALTRALSIMKLRGSDFDHALREFTIGPDGLRVGRRIEGVEGVLTGTGRSSPGRLPATRGDNR